VWVYKTAHKLELAKQALYRAVNARSLDEALGLANVGLMEIE
jgi:hypothetical protein